MKRLPVAESDREIVDFVNARKTPVGVSAISHEFRWCYETAAGKLRALVKAGQLLQVPKAGDVAPMSGRRGPGYVKADAGKA